MHFGRWAAAGFLCGLGLAACKFSELNEEHCENNEGDATCLARYPDGSRPYCGRGTCFTEVEDGCLAEAPTDDACTSPCGGQTYGDEPDGRECIDSSTMTGDDGTMTTGPTGGSSMTGDGTDTDSGMTMSATDGPGSSSDDGPIGCLADDDCPEADAPFCINMQCAPCSATPDPDAACADKFPEMPACVASECVECSATVTSACTGTTPLCDAEANTCVGCTSHEDCPDSACHIPYPDGAHATDQDGACFDPKAVVHVGTGQTYASITEALDTVAEGGEGVIIVHNAGSSYDEAVVVNGDRMLAILAADGEEPQWVQTIGGMGSQLSIEGSLTTVYLHRMRLSTNADPDDAAIHLQGGRVHIQRSQIVANFGGGIEAESNALVHVENSFLGGSANNVSAIAMVGGDASVLYSTVVAGYGASARSLSCTTTGAVSVRNSILLGETASPSVECPTAIFENSASEEALGMGGNVTVDDFDGNQTTWFTGDAASRFSLTSGAANTGEAIFCDVAVWRSGDPVIDIDNTARPTTDSTPDCAGADVP